ncbi:MAG: sulfatase-like hydrolase/transferase [Rhodobiaceae bacterium]|nr:sulfatase-like hydrolase/transferase [Rhodobiaceae bacterium]
MVQSQPNILLIITDQHRADHTGFGGNSLVQTPNLDRIASSGTVFDKAYVANPICMPNRSSILTGVVPSSHGVRYNGLPLDTSFETFVRIARDAGYKTSLVGKSHLQNMNDGPGIATALFKDSPQKDVWRQTAPEGWDQYELDERHKSEKVDIPEDFYGFDDLALTVQHSDYCSGHYYRWLIDKGVKPETIQGLEVAQNYSGNWQQVWKTSVPEELYPTTYVADETVRRIEHAATEAAPFLIQCSFPDPHHPFTPPGKYFDMYDPADVALPQTFNQDHSKSPGMFQSMIETRGSQLFKMAPFSPTEEQFRDMAAKEYGMITMIDDAVGRVLQALEKSGLADDTIVIFTSDHGDVFGDHGLMLKSTMHYEGVIRVPLAISGPGINSARSTSLVSSLDIGSTILDLIGEEARFGTQGQSLRPVLDDPTTAIRDQILVEEEQIFPDPDTGRQINMRSVVTSNGRLTVKSRQPLVGELYDFQNDPLETNNLFDDGAANGLKTEMMDRLVDTMMTHSTSLRRPLAMA